MNTVGQCPDCGGKKSGNALWCVHCGSIKFWRMVTFMVSWAIAAIPAGLILACFSAFFYFVIIDLGLSLSPKKSLPPPVSMSQPSPPDQSPDPLSLEHRSNKETKRPPWIPE